MRRIIHVISKDHSGSTLLDLMLSSGGKALGLGEVRTVLTKLNHKQALSNPCSCGKAGVDCPFWGGILADLKDNWESSSPLEKYQRVLTQARNQYGEDIDLIDSSKDIAWSLKTAELEGVETLYIHLTKDVRSYAVSIADMHLRKSRKSQLPEQTFRSWYNANKTFSRELKQTGQPTYHVQYEALCLDTEMTARSLNTALGSDYINLGAQKTDIRTHILSGNRMREEFFARPTLADNIRYDYRWFYSREWVRAYWLLWHVRHYNESLYQSI